MASNTLTGLIPVIYKGLDVVARERIGLIPAVTLDSDLAQAAVGQSVRSFVTPSSSSVSITPGAYAPDTGGQSIAYNEILINKAKAVPVSWTGEEVRSVGSQYEAMLAAQFAQAFRTISNEIEVDLATAMLNGASRAFGTAGTTPFGTAGDLSDSAGVLRILDDNGTPFQDLHYVANNATMANFRGKQSVLFKANEAGTDELLRQGVIGQLQGMMIGQSNALGTGHTKGTGANTYVTTSNISVGATTIPATSGSGTILAGDIVTFAGDTNKYVVTSDLAAGSFTIGGPGLKVANTTGTVITVGANYTGDLAFHRSSTVLLARPPIMPPGGDMALDVMDILDPVSGLPFQVALYRQYRQLHIEVSSAWGVKVIKGDYIATNLG